MYEMQARDADRWGMGMASRPASKQTATPTGTRTATSTAVLVDPFVGQVLDTVQVMYQFGKTT